MDLKKQTPWLATAVVAAFVAVLLLPPRPLPDWGEHGLIGAMWPNLGGGWAPRYDREVASVAYRLRERIRAQQAGRQVFIAAAGRSVLRTADGAITLVPGPGITADEARRYLDALRAELALIPATEVRVPLIVGLKARADSGDIAVARFVTIDTPQPACMVLINTALLPSRFAGRFRLDSAGTRSRFLDWCALYARFGMPGPAVRAWVGLTDNPRNWFGELLLDAYLDEALKGFQQRGTDDAMAFVRACWKSGGEPCLRSVRLDGSARSPSFGENRWLIADLLVHDPVRFGRFWRSEQPARVALGDAWGTDPAAVVQASMRRHVNFQSAGFFGRSLLSSVGWLAVLVGAGIVASHAWEGRARRI